MKLLLIIPQPLLHALNHQTVCLLWKQDRIILAEAIVHSLYAQGKTKDECALNEILFCAI